MTINDPIKFCANLWDWACLNGCFDPTKIKLMDLDGIVERNGKFLVFETKEPYAQIPTGQGILLRALAAEPNFTVIVIFGYPSNPIEIWYWKGNVPTIINPATIDDLRNIVKTWFESVDFKGKI